MSSLRRLTVTIGPTDAGCRLDDAARGALARERGALGREMGDPPRSLARRLVVAGAVTVDGRVVRGPGAMLAAGARVVVSVDLDKVAADTARRSARAELSAADILFDDGCLLAVAKPAGLAVHATADPARDDFYSAVRRMLAAHRTGARLAPDGLPVLALHHRLDVDTSGVVLFNTDPSVNARLTELFATRQVEKVYHAIARAGGEAWTGRRRFESNLAPTGTGRTARVRSVRKGGQPAVTVAEVLRRFRFGLLVEARPETGRKHQVRAHLAEAGLPLLGDRRYGGPVREGGIDIPRVMLHAFRIALPHPLDGRPVSIECPYAADFAALLARLAV